MSPIHPPLGHLDPFMLLAVAQEMALFGHIVPSQWETARGMKLSLATKFQAIQK